MQGRRRGGDRLQPSAVEDQALAGAARSSSGPSKGLSHDPDGNDSRRGGQFGRQEDLLHPPARRLGRPVRPAGRRHHAPRSRRRRPTARSRRAQVVKAVIVRTVQGAPPQGRQLHPLRQQLRGPDQRRRRADRHPRLRPGGPRAARAAVHEDHLPRAGSHLSRMAESRERDQEERPGPGDRGQGPGRARAASCASCPARAGPSSSAST